MEPALTFNAVEFATITRNGQPWLRLPQIEGALGYNTKGKAIQTLYARHADEFTDEMTAVVKLPTDGGEQDVRIFSLRGCHLLAMFARTPVAKEFRRWVLDVLDKIAEAERQLQKPVLTSSTTNDRKPLRSLVNAWSRASGLHQDTLWPQVRSHFQLRRIDELPREWIGDAIAWVQSKIDALPLPKAEEQQKTLPATKPKQRLLPVVQQPSYRERCSEAIAAVIELRGSLWRVTEKMYSVFRDPFWRNDNIPDDKKAFAHSMNYAVQAFLMAVNNDLQTAEHLFTAYVEAERMLERGTQV